MQVVSGPFAQASGSGSALLVGPRDAGGAHMSQELPSFHDWSQAGNTSPSSITNAAITPAAVTFPQLASTLSPDPVAATAAPIVAAAQEADDATAQLVVESPEGLAADSAEFAASALLGPAETVPQLPQAVDAEGSESAQQEASPDELTALQLGAAQQAAALLDLSAGADGDVQQGMLNN